MKSSIRSKLVAVGAVMLGAFGLSQAAQAHTDVVFSVGIPGYVQPAYVAPEPVYVQPREYYVQRDYYAEPAPVYVAPGYAYERERAREWRRAEWRREEWRRMHRWHERHDGGYYGNNGYYSRY